MSGRARTYPDRESGRNGEHHRQTRPGQAGEWISAFRHLMRADMPVPLA
jgi:hypothetical protein